MANEQLSNFDPVQEATRLVYQDRSKRGWSKADWDLAQRLIKHYFSVLDETRVEIRYSLTGAKKPRLWSGNLGPALAQGVEKFGVVFEGEPKWGESNLAEVIRQAQEREAQEAEARRHHLHLLAWTDIDRPEITSLPRNQLGVPIKSIELARDPADFCTRAAILHQRVSGRVILLVEGKARLMVAMGLINLKQETLHPERIFFLGIAANEEELNPLKEFLLTRLELPPEKLIGVIPRAKDPDEFRSNILTVLKEAFPPPGSDSLPQN